MQMLAAEAALSGFRQQRPLTLVLGAGGTRGFAHLAVMQVLVDAGVCITALKGISAGALFGAIYAVTGRRESLDTGMETNAREVWGLFRDRLRLAPSNRLGDRLARHYGEARLEELPLPMTVIAADLESGEEVQLREGSLRSAVEASIAIPLIARPVEIGGRQLIDGAYARTPPAQLTPEPEGVTVFVSLGEFSICPPRLHGAVSRLARRLQRHGGRRARLGATILAIAHGGYELPPVDLVIAPRLEGINPNSPFAAGPSFERGRRAAQQALPALLRLLGERPAAQEASNGTPVSTDLR